MIRIKVKKSFNKILATIAGARVLRDISYKACIVAMEITYTTSTTENVANQPIIHIGGATVMIKILRSPSVVKD